MKKLLECDFSGLGLLISANLSLAGLAELLSGLEPVLKFLLSLGQIAVAVATTYYIIRRIKRLEKKDNGNGD